MPTGAKLDVDWNRKVGRMLDRPLAKWPKRAENHPEFVPPTDLSAVWPSVLATTSTRGPPMEDSIDLKSSGSEPSWPVDQCPIERMFEIVRLRTYMAMWMATKSRWISQNSRMFPRSVHRQDRGGSVCIDVVSPNAPVRRRLGMAGAGTKVGLKSSYLPHPPPIDSSEACEPPPSRPLLPRPSSPEPTDAVHLGANALAALRRPPEPMEGTASAALAACFDRTTELIGSVEQRGTLTWSPVGLPKCRTGRHSFEEARKHLPVRILGQPAVTAFACK